MTQYQAITTFISIHHGTFRYGDVILEEKYERLRFSEQKNFRKIEKEEVFCWGRVERSEPRPDDTDNQQDDTPYTPPYEAPEEDRPIFDGGSFGGAGAGGDFDNDTSNDYGNDNDNSSDTSSDNDGGSSNDD